MVSADGAVLITPREANLPSDDTLTRGVFAGPKVLVVSPAASAVAVKSPVDLVIEFRPRGDVAVDLNSLSVTYMKVPPVDLTARVKEFVTPTGIAMPSAVLPPGHHTIEIEIKDAEGRVGGREFYTRRVAPEIKGLSSPTGISGRRDNKR